MKLSALARLSTCLLLCLPPALLGHCGGTAGTEPGTETGNPPRVDEQMLRLVRTATGAELFGEPGAVNAGATVRLTNRDSGNAAAVPARADGSFRVEVPGSALDTYEVTVTQRGGSVTLPLTVLIAGTLTSVLSELSCEELANEVEDQLRRAVAPSTVGCFSDADCVPQSWAVGCYEGCGWSYVLASQQATASAAAEQSVVLACGEIERRCGPLPAPSCAGGPDSSLPECYQGACRPLGLSGLSCEALSSRAGERRADLIAAADRSCTVDADCTLVTPELSCFAGCSLEVSIASSAAPTLLANLKPQEDSLCGAFEQNACPPPIQPPCVPNPGTPAAQCLQGQCAVTFPTLLP